MSARRIEDLDELIAGIVHDGAEVGRTAERAVVRSGGIARRGVGKPDLQAQLMADLREALADEVVVSRPLEAHGVISEREEHREIAKRALAGIKLPQLRTMAEDLGLARGGRLEEVLDRIVGAMKADEEEIARLIIAYETEPPPERRFVTRLFPLTRSTDDLELVATGIEPYTSRYFKVGIARWMVIDGLQVSDGLLRLRGTYRYYTADAAREGDEDYSLRALNHSASTELRIASRRAFVQVDAKGATASRAAAIALDHASMLSVERGLAFPGTAEGPLFGWDPRTVFMLRLLSSRFQSDQFEVLNLTTAGFEQRRSDQIDGEDMDRPSVHSVRFQGRHLLDSVPACNLIVRGQGFIELNLTLRWSEGDSRLVLPVGIRIERDHITVATGFGLCPPNAVRVAHRMVIDGVERIYAGRDHGEAAVHQLARDIREISQSGQTPQHARLLGSHEA